MDKPSRGRFRQPTHEILVEMGRVSPDQVANLTSTGGTSERELVKELLELDVVTEDDVAQALGIKHGLEYTDLEDIAIQPNVRLSIDRRYQLKHEIVPLAMHELSVTICVADPARIAMLKMEMEVKFPGKMVKFKISSPERIRAAIRGKAHGIKQKDSEKQVELNIETMWKPFDQRDNELGEAVFGGRVRHLSVKACTIEGSLPSGDLPRQLTFRKAVMKLNIFLVEGQDPVRAVGRMTTRAQSSEAGKHRYDVEIERLGEGDAERIKEYLASL